MFLKRMHNSSYCIKYYSVCPLDEPVMVPFKIHYPIILSAWFIYSELFKLFSDKVDLPILLCSFDNS